MNCLNESLPGPVRLQEPESLPVKDTSVNQDCSVSNTHSEERWLKEGLRDLTAFTSLPLLYKDKTPRDIADSLASVLQTTLRPDFVLGRITGPFSNRPIAARRAASLYPNDNPLRTAELV